MSIFYFEKRLYSHRKVVNRRTSCVQHYHNTYELYYMVEGSTEYIIDGERYNVSKGDFVYVPKQMLHATDSGKCMNTERILITFDEKSLDESIMPVLDVLAEYKLIHISKDGVRNIEKLLYMIKTEYEAARPYKELMLRLYISELLISLSRYIENKNPGTSKNSILINQVSEYIVNNYSEDISLSSLAERFYVSQSYLSRCFKAHFGVGINEYIRSIRIEQSAKLLADTDMKVSEVALMCGFDDSNYFSSVFKKHKGITPYKYSKIYKD